MAVSDKSVDSEFPRIPNSTTGCLPPWPSIPRILRTEHRSSAIVIRPDGASSGVPGDVGEVATRSSLPLIQANLEGNFFGTLRFLCTLHKIHAVRFVLRISGVGDCRQLQVSYPIPQIHPSHQISPRYIFHLSILGYFQLRLLISWREVSSQGSSRTDLHQKRQPRSPQPRH